MRTTLTIDDDVAALLDRLRKNRDASLKDLVNEGLRRGLWGYGRSTKTARALPYAVGLARSGANSRRRQHRRGARHF